MAGSAFSVEHEQHGPPAGANLLPTPDPRRHSMVCCCLRCDSKAPASKPCARPVATMGGSWRRSVTRLCQPTSRRRANLTKDRKPSRYGATPMRRREPGPSPRALRRGGDYGESSRLMPEAGARAIPPTPNRRQTVLLPGCEPTWAREPSRPPSIYGGLLASRAEALLPLRSRINRPGCETCSAPCLTCGSGR